MLLRSRELDDGDSDAIKCPIRQILGRIGGRWTLDVIMLLGDGPRHFADLDRCIPKISRRMLTLTLRALERDGLIARRGGGKAGTIVQYEITDLGRGLNGHLHALTEWSRTQRDAIYEARDLYDRVTAGTT
jgi:DNA-binding HxlR family transcriptional regulator